jgi:hypothetical protein
MELLVVAVILIRYKYTIILGTPGPRRGGMMMMMMMMEHGGPVTKHDRSWK